MNRLVLASASPRRRQLLAVLGFEFDVVRAEVAEHALDGESPPQLTARLAEAKARHVAERVGDDRRVLGGDTVVALDGEIMGKPRDREQAVDMLGRLSGRTHAVYSSVALVDGGRCRSMTSESRVTFDRLSARRINDYCDTDDPYDKAGAYGIQGPASGFVTRLEGSYSAVVGLPLWEVHQLLMETEVSDG